MAMKKGSSSGENYTSNTWSNQDIFIGSTSSDADSGIRSTSITLDGCKTTSTTMMITTEGTHTLKISAEDYAGNVSESDEAIIKIDKTNPNSNIVLNNQQTKTITKKVANETTTTYIATNNNLEDSENGPLRMETIPADGTYKIMVYGAAGTDSINSPTYGMSKGGKGALVYGTFQFKANDMLVIGIGTKGTITGTLNSGATDAVSGPGGGLSFVAKYEDDKMNTLLMAAGGNGDNDTLSQHTIKNGADGICTAGTNNDGLNMINNQSEEFVNQATISKNGLTSTTGLFLGKAEDDNNSAGGGAQIGDGANNTGAYSYITSSATDTGGESGNNSDTGKVVLIREDYTDVTYTASVIDFNLSAADQVSKISLDNSKYFIDDDSNLKGVNSTSWNSAKNLQSENFETTEEITQDGKHYIHLLAKDNANNYSEKIKEIISDTTAPTITVTSSGVDSYPDILTVNVTDNVAGTKNIELPDGSIINTNGSMNYTTTYNVTKNGPLTFKSTDMQGNIQVVQYQEENVINFETEWTISSANTNITLPLYGVTDVYVDYGDGTKTAIKDTLSMTTTDGKVFTGNCPTHTYSAVGTYKIKISGNCEQYLFNDSSENYLTKIDKWGCLQNTRYAFGGNYYDLEPWQYMEHYSDMFSTGSSNIRGSIPTPNIHSFEKLSTADYMFTICGFEGNIPTGLFDSAINVKSYDGTFANCGLLTGSIPAGLFSKSTKVTEFTNTFKYCRKLTGSIPENIFANNTKLINELGSFALCDSLTGNIPTGIFANNLDIEYIMSTFTYCSGLTGSIPAEIFKNNTKVKDISGVFSECTNLSGTIPSNIFNYNTNVTSFSNVFGDCKGITGTIPENLFANNVNLTEMYGMFYGCSGITGTIPGNLFANNVNLKTLRGIFSECSNISGTVPENLLINNIKIEDINSLFRKCTQIT